MIWTTVEIGLRCRAKGERVCRRGQTHVHVLYELAWTGYTAKCRLGRLGIFLLATTLPTVNGLLSKGVARERSISEAQGAETNVKDARRDVGLDQADSRRLDAEGKALAVMQCGRVPFKVGQWRN